MEQGSERATTQEWAAVPDEAVAPMAVALDAVMSRSFPELDGANELPLPAPLGSDILPEKAASLPAISISTAVLR